MLNRVNHLRSRTHSYWRIACAAPGFRTVLALLRDQLCRQWCLHLRDSFHSKMNLLANHFVTVNRYTTRAFAHIVLSYCSIVGDFFINFWLQFLQRLISLLRFFLELLWKLKHVEIVFEPVETFAQLLQVKDPANVIILAFLKLRGQLLHLIWRQLCHLFGCLSLFFIFKENHFFVHLVNFFASTLDFLFKLSFLLNSCLKLILEADNFNMLFEDLGLSVFQGLLLLCTVSIRDSGFRFWLSFW